MFGTSFFDGVGDFFGRAWDWVADAASTIGDAFVGNVKTVITAPTTIATTLYNDAKTVVSAVDKDINLVLDRGSGLLNNVVDKGAGVITTGQQVLGGTVSSVGESFALPLTIGAVALAAILILK